MAVLEESKDTCHLSKHWSLINIYMQYENIYKFLIIIINNHIITFLCTQILEAPSENCWKFNTSYNNTSHTWF